MPDEIRLRKGKTKTLLESSIDAALLAVEVYNKPRTTFRSENFIVLMIIAWTKLFHAFFNSKRINYCYKKKKDKDGTKDEELRFWELKHCIDQVPELPNPVKNNLEFFIGLRNKIEHRYIEKSEIDAHIFGECQAMLLNYESTLERLFGSKYSLNESLIFSLQFSRFYPVSKRKSTKKILTKAAESVVEYITNFRETLSEEIFNSQEYSIKLLLIPKISNTKKGDLAVEFHNFDPSNEKDQNTFSKISVLVKERKQHREAINVGRLKPLEVVEKVNMILPKLKFNLTYHTYLWKIFGIRPSKGAAQADETETEFCQYDIPHKDYLYTDKWVEFIISLLHTDEFSLNNILIKHKNGEKLDTRSYSTLI